MHVDAGREEAGHGHGHLVGARALPLRRRHPGRGHAVHPGPLTPVRAAARSGRPLVMGVLNVTPDSFSDGGLYDTFERAVARGPRDDGRGGRRDRRGRRVVPARAPSPFPPTSSSPGWCRCRGPGRRRRAHGRGVRISVDTVKPEVAAAAVAAGATPGQRHLGLAVRGGGRRRRRLGRHAHAGRAPHHAGRPALRRRGRPRCAPSCSSGPGRARAAGVGEVWVDPGIGFGKTIGPQPLAAAPPAPTWCEAAADAGCAGVAGRHQPQALPRAAGRRRPRPEPSPRRWPTGGEGSLATAAAALVAGAGMVRVHDVAATVQVARLYGPAA